MFKEEPLTTVGTKVRLVSEVIDTDDRGRKRRNPPGTVGEVISIQDDRYEILCLNGGWFTLNENDFSNKVEAIIARVT